MNNHHTKLILYTYVIINQLNINYFKLIIVSKYVKISQIIILYSFFLN